METASTLGADKPSYERSPAEIAAEAQYRRERALDYAGRLGGPLTAEDLILAAKQIEAYIVGNAADTKNT